MGRYPADKYNMTTEQAGAALSALGDAPLAVARTMLRWVAFAFVTGDGDLMALASTWRPPPRAAGKVLDEVVERVEAWSPSLDDGDLPQRTLHKWRRAIDFRRQRLAA